MDEAEKFTELKKEIVAISEQKIRIEERYKNCKTQLSNLLKEITDNGYDPKKLSDIKEKKEAELKKEMGDLEEKVNKVKSKLNEIELNID